MVVVVVRQNHPTQRRRVFKRERRRGEASHTLLGARARVTLPGGALELWGTNLTDESYPDLTTVYTQQPAPGRALRIAYREEVGGR